MPDQSPAPSLTQGPNGYDIAYHKLEGSGPTVIFLGGFMSNMEGSKALALEAHCKAAGRAFLRFDYGGHGQSGGAFVDGTVKTWAADAAHMLDNYTSGPVILVGSSMGGWIGCLLARSQPERIAGFIGIAAAPDFTRRAWTQELTDEQRTAIEQEGRVAIPSQYGPDPYIFTKALFDDGVEVSVLNKPLRIDAPVRLLQGLDDPDVEWDTPVALAQHLYNSGSRDVEAIIVPGSDHRMSSESDIARLLRTLESIGG